ncbi:hypothetical protein NDA17_000858 [Ustilago hordei]|nr:hypothetical protein NDA17_000858 [Ustilago hordei]
MGLVTDQKLGNAHIELLAHTTRRSALHLDVLRSCLSLKEELSTSRQAIDLLQRTTQDLDAGLAVSQALDRLAGLLLIPECTLSTAAHFKPLLLDLLVRAFKQTDSVGTSDVTVIAKALHTIAILISIFPEVYELLTKFVGISDFSSFHHKLSSEQPEYCAFLATFPFSANSPSCAQLSHIAARPQRKGPSGTSTALSQLTLSRHIRAVQHRCCGSSRSGTYRNQCLDT